MIWSYKEVFRRINPKIAALPRTKRVLLNVAIIIVFPVVFVAMMLVLPVVALLGSAGFYIWKFFKKTWSHFPETVSVLLLVGKFLGFAVLWALFGFLFVALGSFQMTMFFSLRIIFLLLCLGMLFLFALVGPHLRKQVAYLRYAIRTKGHYWSLENTRDKILRKNAPDEPPDDPPDKFTKIATYVLHHGATLSVAAASLVLVGGFGMFVLLSIDLSLLAPHSLFGGRELASAHIVVWILFVCEQMLRSIPALNNLIPSLSGIAPIFPWGHIYIALLQLSCLGILILVGFFGYFAFFVERSFGRFRRAQALPPKPSSLPPGDDGGRPEDYEELLREEHETAASLLAMAMALLRKAGHDVVDMSSDDGIMALKIQQGQQRVYVRPHICYRTFDECTVFEALQMAAVSIYSPVVLVSCGSISGELADYANRLHPKIRFADLDLNHTDDREHKIVEVVEDLLQRQNRVGIAEKAGESKEK